MTNIDLQRLAKDPEYWPAVAPEGATHYDPDEVEEDAPWLKLEEPDDARARLDNIRELKFWNGEVWCTVPNMTYFRNYQHRFIARPVKIDLRRPGRLSVPRFEHEGQLQEFLHENCPNWTSLQSYVVFYEELTGRKLPSEGQREREELIDIIGRASSLSSIAPIDARDIADEILAAHFHK